MTVGGPVETARLGEVTPVASDATADTREAWDGGNR